MSIRRRTVLAACLAVAAAAPARSAEPLYKDSERHGGGAEIRTYDADPHLAGRHAHRRPARRVTGGPGYVGSDYGLGKPAFTGLGSRPDWGRSSE